LSGNYKFYHKAKGCPLAGKPFGEGEVVLVSGKTCFILSKLYFYRALHALLDIRLDESSVDELGI